MKLKTVEITSIEKADYGDCIILDLIIPPGQFKKEDNVDKSKSRGRHMGTEAEEFCEEK